MFFVKCFIDIRGFDKEQEKYEVYGYLFDTIDFDKEEGDYYFFNKSHMFSSGEQFVIPKSTAEITIFSKMYPPVIIYCPKDATLYDSQVKIGNKDYTCCSNLIKLSPNYTLLFIIIAGADLLILFLLKNVLG